MSIVKPLLIASLIFNASLIQAQESIKGESFDSKIVHGSLNLEDATANEELTVYGTLNAKHSKLNNVQVYGQTEIEDSQLLGALEVRGETELEHCQILDSVQIHGATEFEKSQFSKFVKLSGSTEIEESSFLGPITINGHASIEESEFHDLVTINGGASIDESMFNKDVLLRTKNVSFNNSMINGSLTIDTSVPANPQLVTLSKTTIKGDVEFKSEMGEIHLDKDSKIEGRVIGAKVTQES
jgi:hypothetical protein